MHLDLEGLGRWKMLDTNIEVERVILVSAYVSSLEEAEKSLDELEELVDTAGEEVVSRLYQKISPPDTRTYIGSGKVEELKALALGLEATMIITDDELTGVQMKNLESQLDLKVVDRTILILDIFARRAITKEGKLQVELAQLTNLSRHLVGSYNLSRLGGGIGTRGPGEKKLEMDRRLIRQNMNNIRHELKDVKKHRELTRKARQRSKTFTFSIVGYTNAGKSTLLNTLTNANVLQEDKLFATLDLTTREFVLPNSKTVLLTDTVGFINKLPHNLVQAFRGTLEEAKYSDALIHVVDASDEDYEKKMLLVYELLKELGVEGLPIITLFNKIDKMEDEKVLRDSKATWVVKTSLIEGKGIEEVVSAIEEVSTSKLVYIQWLVGYNCVSIIAQIRAEGSLEKEEYREDGVYIEAYVTEEIFNRWHKLSKENDELR